MAVIAPFNYERYAVLVSPLLIPGSAPEAVPAVSRATQELQTLSVDIGLKGRKQFHDQQALTTPHSMAPPPAPTTSPAPLAVVVAPQLNTPWIPPNGADTFNVKVMAKIVAGLYAPPNGSHGAVGETLNVVG